MPLPLLFIGIAAATAALGVGKTGKAIYDIHDAKTTNEAAQRLADDSTERANLAREKCGAAIKNLGKEKVTILNGEVKHFVESFEKLHNVELKGSAGLKELSKFKMDKASFADLKALQSTASSIAAGVGSGAVAGALTAFGAYSAAGAFAAASTGTAIASLSGAAATNATLAFFGGGSLAAGGLGVAGGTAVLGGLVAGPALAVMGFVVGAKAKASRHNAHSNYAKSREFAEEMETVISCSDNIRKRANLLERLLIKLDCVFTPLVYSMDTIIQTSGTDFSKFTKEQKKTVAASLAMAGAIKSVLDTPLLTEDGSLTDESELILNETKQLLLTNG